MTHLATRPSPTATSRRHFSSPGTWWAVGAGVSGIAVGTGFAPLGWWAASVLGTSGLALAVRQTTTTRHALLTGFVFGVGLTASTLSWMSAINDAAAAGLILVQSLWYAGIGALLHLAGGSRWWPLLGAGAWVAVEYGASRAPFGGFGWLRLGYAMIDSPLAGLLPLVGVAGVTFATATISHVSVWLAESPSRRSGVLAAAAIAGVAAGAAIGGAIPPAAAAGTASVGWVQGGAPGGGVYGLGPPRTITTNQAAATARLAADVRSGRDPIPDFVVWPENSTDLDPGTDAATKRLIDASLALLGRPLLVGAILDGPAVGERQTATQWRTPDGGVGPTYIKRSIVPFGEWIPFRDLLLPLVPDLRYVGAQSVRGTQPGLLTVDLRDGSPITLGVLACFDVAFDPVVHDVANADLLVVQTSNAMYQGTAQIEQQFAITRARAAELRREILVVATSGVSGLIGPTGRVLERDTGPGPAFGVVQIPLRSGTTPAAWLASPLESAMTATTAVLLTAIAIRSRYRRRRILAGS